MHSFTAQVLLGFDNVYIELVGWYFPEDFQNTSYLYSMNKK